MPIKLAVSKEYNVAVFIHHSNVPDDEFLDFYKSYFTSDQFDQKMKLLVDLSRTDSSHRSSEGLYKLAEYMHGKIRADGGTLKIAVIAPEDISFGMSRMYSSLTDGSPWEFMTFREEEPALEWLGVPNDLLKNLDASE